MRDPPQISHSMVPTTPIHSKTEIFPIVVIAVQQDHIKRLVREIAFAAAA